MSAEDRARYGAPGLQPDAARGYTHPKTDKLEREEQRQFASWLMLHDLPLVWHRTDKRTGCNVGCPDFIAAIQGWEAGLRWHFDNSCRRISFSSAARSPFLARSTRAVSADSSSSISLKRLDTKRFSDYDK